MHTYLEEAYVIDVQQFLQVLTCNLQIILTFCWQVSATKKGLIPLSQEALICGQVSYHDYRGILVDQDERDQLARNLGPFNKVITILAQLTLLCTSFMLRD